MLAKVLDRMLIAGAAISALLLFADAILTVVAVVSRYVFNEPLGWYVELVEYSLFFITFLSTGWLLRQAGHVKIELLAKKIRNDRLRMAIRLFVCVVVIVVAGVLSVYSIIVMSDMVKANVISTKILSVPRWILVTPIVAGSVLLLAEGIRQLIFTIRRREPVVHVRTPEAVDVDQL